MKNIIILLSLLFANLLSFSKNKGIDELQKAYSKVKSDSATCAKLYEKVTKENSTDNTVICYKGAITAAMANFAKSKSEKLKLFKEGKNLMEQAIAKDSTNIELIFLRFTIQSSCPKILGYNKQIESDKTLILTNFNSITSAALKNGISSFLIHSPFLTEAEKQKLTK